MPLQTKNKFLFHLQDFKKVASSHSNDTLKVEQFNKNHLLYLKN